MKTKKINHVFQTIIQDELEENKVYISLDYNTAIHKCACGCGEEVVTPISPSDWKLIYNGESVSLSPSIGNWSYSCRSHYWIRDGYIVWAENWTEEKVNKIREKEKKNQEINKRGLFKFIKKLFK